MTSRDKKKFDAMAVAGRISSAALKKALFLVKPGISLLELDKMAEKEILALGAVPAFKRVDGYKYTTCINVNDGIVHGIPTEYRIKKGDLVSVDLGAYYDGYNSDQCETVEVETSHHKDFLLTGKRALEKAIEQAIAGNRVGDISYAIQEEVVGAGYNVSRELVGHGVGKKLHEAPFVPCYGKKNRGPSLYDGQTLAIEILYMKGNYGIITDDDGWTIRTSDGSLSAVFEHTIGITSGEPLIFTYLS